MPVTSAFRCTSPVIAALVILAAGSASLDAKNFICSNSKSLNDQFVSLLAEHLEFKPDVVINPSQEPEKPDFTAGIVSVVVAQGDYASVLGCVSNLGFDPVIVEAEVIKKRNKLGKPSGQDLSGVPSDTTTGTGSVIAFADRRLFLSVSEGDSLVAAEAAVTAVHGLHNPKVCWFSTECREAAEAFWAQPKGDKEGQLRKE